MSLFLCRGRLEVIVFIANGMKIPQTNRPSSFLTLNTRIARHQVKAAKEECLKCAQQQHEHPIMHTSVPSILSCTRVYLASHPHNANNAAEILTLS